MFGPRCLEIEVAMSFLVFLCLALFQDLDPKKEFDSRRTALKGSRDANAWCDLGEWALEQKFKDKAKSCFQEALKVDSGHERSRDGMLKVGYGEVNGKWLPLSSIYTSKKAKLKKEDIDGLFELAEWCKAHQMPKEQRHALDEILRIDPQNRRAHLELGHTLYHGEWLEEAEVQRELKIDEVWKTALANQWTAAQIQTAIKGTTNASAILEKAKSPGPGTYKETKLQLDRDKYPGEYTYGIPDDYVPWRKSPMIVFLHGGGQNSGDGDEYFPIAWPVGRPRGFIVVCPTVLEKIPNGWNNERHVQYVRTIVREMQQKYNVDPNRLYLWGHSMGGCGAFYIGARCTDLFAAFSPMSGWPYDWLPEKLQKTPVRIVHGDQDKTVPPEGSRRAAQWLKEHGNVYVYDELPGVGHGIPHKHWPVVADWFLNFTLRR